MAATATATASYSTLSPKHNLSLSINHLNKNSALSVSSSRPTKIPMKVSATSAAILVIVSSKSSFDDVASSQIIVDVNLGEESNNDANQDPNQEVVVHLSLNNFPEN